MSPRTIAIVGARGRMGSFARELLGQRSDYAVVLELDRGDDLTGALRETAPELGLDLTVAGLGARHARTMLELGVRPVVGTSGVDREQTLALDELARERGLGGLVVPNFSLGIACLGRAAAELARHYPCAEVLERHHERKRDAPSSTARELARRVAEASGSPAEVPIHSLRLPGHYAHHAVVFGGAGERLELRHDMDGPTAFEPGLLLALGHAASAHGVGFGLEAALADDGSGGT